MTARQRLRDHYRRLEADLAIEALARELTDEQWGERFAELDRAAWNPGTRVRESTRALLTYLDEVWAGLDELYREFLVEPEGLDDTDDPIACAGALAFEASWLARFDGAAALTPLGRAVLKRAKEQGR